MNGCWILSTAFSVLVDMIMIIFMKDFPCGLAGKESTCNAGDLGSVSGLGRFPGEGEVYPLQYSGLENSIQVWSKSNPLRLYSGSEK